MNSVISDTILQPSLSLLLKLQVIRTIEKNTKSIRVIFVLYHYPNVKYKLHKTKPISRKGKKLVFISGVSSEKNILYSKIYKCIYFCCKNNQLWKNNLHVQKLPIGNLNENNSFEWFSFRKEILPDQFQIRGAYKILYVPIYSMRLQKNKKSFSEERKKTPKINQSIVILLKMKSNNFGTEIVQQKR